MPKTFWWEHKVKFSSGVTRQKPKTTLRMILPYSMEGRSASLQVGSRRGWGGARYTKSKYGLLLLIICLVPRRLKCGKRKTRLHEPSWCIAQWTMRTFSMNAKDAGKSGREKWDASQIWFDFSPENSDFWIWAVNRSRCAILRRNNVAQAQEFVLPFRLYFSKN